MAATGEGSDPLCGAGGDAVLRRVPHGVQFHLEVSAEMAHKWGQVPEYAASLERTLGAGAAEQLLEDVARRADEMGTVARTIFARWLELAA